MIDRSKAPEVKPFGFRKLPQDSIERLDNGVSFHTLSGGTASLVQLTLLFPGGKSDVDNSNIPTMASGLVSEGAGPYSGSEIADSLDFAGATFSPHSSKHYTGLSTVVLSHKLPDILPLLRAMTEEPHFEERDIENLKNLLAARLRMDERKVLFRAQTAFNQLIYGAGHHQAIVPTVEQIETVDRATLAKFHGSLVKPERMHAYLAGSLDKRTTEAVKDFLNSLYAPEPEAKGIELRREIPRPEPAQTVFTEMPEAVQSAIYAGVPAIRRDEKDFINLRLAVMALGGYFGSRLMTNIREEKGLTYHIESYLASQHEDGMVVIQAQCNSDNVGEVEDEIRKEMRLMAENPPEGRELERLKLTAMTRLVETLDSPLSVMAYRQLELVTGTPRDYFEAQERAIAAISPEIMANMAAKYLRPEQLRVSIAGPR
ncbi:MAG: insulinase family protein [Muribaculaceae bacterium]|nr:insulinase family protein [Muribaculaceae bacterium]